MHLSKVSALGALTVALSLTAGAAQAATLTRSPYLQLVGPETATVAFRLDANCSAEVRYGVGGATDQVARSKDSGRTHAVRLDNLKPGTEYSYMVEACGGRTEPKKFSTAPVPGTRSVHFAAVGDFGTGGNDQKKVFATMRARGPELLLALGDNAYESGTESELQNRLFAPMADLLAEVPFFPVAGNHEYVTDQSQPYLNNFYLPTDSSGTERYYSFDWGHVHFVGLDSSCAIGLASKERCTLDAQKKWAEQDLKNSKAPWKVVYFHHPPWSSGAHGSQLLMRREFGPMFEKYGVDLVLTGHDHNYERSRPMIGDGVAQSGEQGIPYLVVGGGGANLRGFDTDKPAWSEIRNNKDYGYLDVRVVEGTLTAQLVTSSGGTADSFTLTKQLPPQEPAPSADFELIVEGERGVAPHRALFRTNLPGTDTAVSWDFGDGEAGEGSAVEHVYAKPGEYTVTATAGATLNAPSRTSTARVLVSAAGGTPSPGTPGTPSSPGTSTPDFPEAEPSASGCSALPASALLPLGALALAGLLRRRRRH